jgi:hypothetical protein
MGRLKVWILGVVLFVMSLAALPTPANAQIVVRVGPHPHRYRWHGRYYHHRYYRHHRWYYR